MSNDEREGRLCSLTVSEEYRVKTFSFPGHHLGNS